MYRIGIVGVGHWSKRLVKGIGDRPFEVHKTVDVLPYGEKSDLLGALGVSRDRHYEIEAGDALPEDFFDGVDIVQIASPVEYHLEQTRQALDRADVVVTEKSYGANRDEFEEAVEVLDGRWDESLLHLHYLNKIPTRIMPEVLERAVEEDGRVERVEATFIEERSPEDAGRAWLFEPANGGVMLDWVHPIEVLSVACGASLNLRDGTAYRVAPDYSEYATAARATYDVGDATGGALFADDATARINIGKGFDETHKRMRFVLQDSAVDFVYASSDREFETDYRGEWKRIRDGRVVESGKPTGPIPYETLVEDIEDAVESEGTWVDEETVRRIYEPVWEFNDSVGIENPVEDGDAVEEFETTAVEATEEVSA